MARNRRRRPRRRGGSAAVYTIIAVLLIAFITIFGVSVFFKVADIEVTGAVKYHSGDIIKASGIEKGDNLMLFDRGAAAARICSAMPYITEVKIARRLPDRIVIEITESEPMAEISSGGAVLLVDQNARLLEINPAALPEHVIAVTGITPVSPVAGKKIEVSGGEKTALAFLTDVLGAIRSKGVSDGITRLDVSNISNITFDYLGRFDVLLGSAENVNYKLDKLVGIVSALDSERAGQEGTLDLSQNGKSSFIPKSG